MTINLEETLPYRRRLKIEGDPVGDRRRNRRGNPWIETMANLKFVRSERGTVTVLLGGLTMAQDRLVEGAFRGLGYRVLALDCPDLDALRLGKEYGNRGQCNPTYFTVGNLVKYLLELERGGMAREEIVKRYVFLTASACGPCRFGMYVTEYRKALRDAGFDGFRVVSFQQQGGLSQVNGDDAGLEMSPRFFAAMLKALAAGDVINALGYRLRPYEVQVGATDAAISRTVERCYNALLAQKSVVSALLRSRFDFARIEIDRSRPKPKVSIIGEFWAMTTEGAGNHRLQRFIEDEGGEVDVQLVTAWLLYNIWELRYDTLNRAELRTESTLSERGQTMGDYGVFKRLATLWLAEKGLRLGFFVFSRSLGLRGYSLPNMENVADVSKAFYNNDVRGGEGHMEIGKVILNAVGKKSTMTLSVKPFGCMPSSGVSDGIQSLIQERYPGTIFCAVETSGEGEVNFRSRVQMYLHKAKHAAREELEDTLERSGLTLERFQVLASHAKVTHSPLSPPKHYGSTTATDVAHSIGRTFRLRERAAKAVRQIGFRKLTSVPDSIGS